MWDMANFIANAIKENGLVLPVDYTEEEFFEVGRCLAIVEQGTQWAIGDWYNSIPWGDKEAACKEVRLGYETAKKCASICAIFPIVTRSNILGFAHHQLLAIQKLSDTQRAELLEKSSKNGWTAAQLRHERDRLLGRPEKVAVLEFDDRLESLIKELPARVGPKVKGEIRKIYSDLKRDFVTVVERETQKRVQAERTRLLTVRKEIEEERERVIAMARGLTAVMTEEEYKLIRGLLHPDRHPENPERYGKAFEAFSRLEKTIHPDIPARILRERGWKD
jgi:hypothetical protein